MAEVFAYDCCGSDLLSGVKRRMEGVVEHPDAKRGRMDALKAAARPAPRAPFKLPTSTRLLRLSAIHRSKAARSRLHSLTAAVCACKGHSHTWPTPKLATDAEVRSAATQRRSWLAGASSSVAGSSGVRS